MIEDTTTEQKRVEVRKEESLQDMNKIRTSLTDLKVPGEMYPDETPQKKVQ
jgi:hypothetical protein